MNPLVARLIAKPQTVVIGGQYPTLDGFVDGLRASWCFLRFPGLGSLDVKFTLADPPDTANADFDRAVGTVPIVGTASLNYQRIRCLVDIDVATLEGIATVELVDEADH